MSIAESIPTRVAAQMAAPAATAGTRTAFTALRTSTVMMVDDDPLMLEVVQTYLEEAGYVSFITTSQPKEAMGLFVQHRPDILLLDLMMPEVSGFDILAEVRGHEELRYTPVIILTAESDPAAKLTALELGATDLLTKPVDPSELRLRLRNALAFKAYQDRLVDSDPLTGLPNRKKFRVEVEAALARSAATSSRACALLHIDLDRFKQVNDSLGHRVGDRLLSAAAKVLETVFASFKPSHSTGRDAAVAFSRIGGNGFAALLPDLHNLTKVDDATAMARRVQNALSEPFEVDGHKLRISASIGIAVSPGDGEDADTLLKNAEVAMYQSKQRGRKTYTFFSNEMNAHAAERMTLEGQMRKAVDQGEFVLFYQPKVEIASRKITGAEALLRWRHPELGILSPDKFIPIAEETGLIVEIGQWVLRTACAQVAAWHQQGLPRLSVSVNVAVPQFKSGTIWHAVRGAVERSRIPPQLLALELTESMLMDDGEETITTLREIKEMGVRLSVDDFGTGYSSLTYLSRFPIDELKIDRTFVRGLPGERQNAAIVGAILVLGRELGMNVVAEGVETKEQLQFLAQRRCNEFQGYLCSRPAPAEQFAQLVRRSLPQAA
jgi:diguanylate cyclase (GGDEF)-like protein